MNGRPSLDRLGHGAFHHRAIVGWITPAKLRTQLSMNSAVGDAVMFRSAL
jgi:hypothetical protein